MERGKHCLWGDWKEKEYCVGESGASQSACPPSTLPITACLRECKRGLFFDKARRMSAVPRPSSEVPGAAVQTTYPPPDKSSYFTFFVKDNKFEYFAPLHPGRSTQTPPPLLSPPSPPPHPPPPPPPACPQKTGTLALHTLTNNTYVSVTQEQQQRRRRRRRQAFHN